jgi:hypothetical protein
VPILKKKTQFTIQNKCAQHYSLTFWNSQTSRIGSEYLPD